MATNLLTLLDIDNAVVTVHPSTTERLYSGFAGSDGLVAMSLGKRGRTITIQGRLISDNHSSYAAAREDLLSKIYDTELLSDLDADDYTYKNDTYYNMIFDRLELLPSGGGQYYLYDTKGYMSCRFIYYCRILSDEQ